MKEKFIPVALKAKMVANPPAGLEGDLYREIRRTQHVPQGIATMDSTGKVLTWAFSFDNEGDILKFLDHVQARYDELADDTSDQAAIKRRVAAERYLCFPSRKLSDVADDGRSFQIPVGHSAGEHCPGQFNSEAGTLVGTIVGRVLDKDGKPIDKTWRQEQYMESRFELSPAVQSQIAKAATSASDKPFPLPDSVCQALVNPAFLGQLDVDPLGTATNWDVEKHREWKLSGKVQSKSEHGVRIFVTGVSHIAGGETANPNAARYWEHRVKLNWQGFIDIKQDRVVDLIMLANGNEELLWGNQNLQTTTSPDCTHLMAGHPINFDGKVVYGLAMHSKVKEK